MPEIREKAVVKTYRGLNVYQLSYELTVKVFELTGRFPRDEMYSLVDQVRRSSRSIPSNISEGWAKRKFKNVFINI